MSMIKELTSREELSVKTMSSMYMRKHIGLSNELQFQGESESAPNPYWRNVIQCQ